MKNGCVVTTFLRNEASCRAPQKIRNSKFFDNSQENIRKEAEFFKNSRVSPGHRKFFRPDIFRNTFR